MVEAPAVAGRTSTGPDSVAPDRGASGSAPVADPLAAGFSSAGRQGRPASDGPLEGQDKAHNDHLPLRGFIVIHRPTYRFHNAAGRRRRFAPLFAGHSAADNAGAAHLTTVRR